MLIEYPGLLSTGYRKMKNNFNSATPRGVYAGRAVRGANSCDTV